VDWIHLAEELHQGWGIVKTVMNHLFLLNARRFLSGRTAVGLSEITQLHGVSSVTLEAL
jgi:hypothetical protein